MTSHFKTLTTRNEPHRQAKANLKNLRRIFTVPEGDASTLARIEKEISDNLLGFLSSHIVAGDMTPADLERDFSNTVIPNEPMFVSEQTDFLLEKVVAQSVHTASPSFIGHMTSALPYFMLPLAKIMTALNQNTVKIETSKAFTPLERQVVGMLHRLVFNGDEQFYSAAVQDGSGSLGVFCSGGTVANLTSLWVARNRLLRPTETLQGVAELGVTNALKERGYNDLTILVSARGHYSLSKAADILGLGRRQVIKVKTTDDFKIDLIACREALQMQTQMGNKVLAIVGIAGTTETGHIDPLNGLADLAEQYGVHFHVDAAWGGPVLFSQQSKSLLAGIERADSVTIDAHKQLYVPMGAGLALFKEPDALKAIEHHANYIVRAGSRDIGKHTLEGSRPGMAMLVHSALRIIGRQGYELLIDLGIANANYFSKIIRADPDFELMSGPELNLLTYRYVPQKLLQTLGNSSPGQQAEINLRLNQLTESVQKAQRAAGKTFVSRTTLPFAKYGNQEVTVFRVVLANPLTSRSILNEILKEQRMIGVQLWQAMLKQQPWADDQVLSSAIGKDYFQTQGAEVDRMETVVVENGAVELDRTKVDEIGTGSETAEGGRY